MAGLVTAGQPDKLSPGVALFGQSFAVQVGKKDETIRPGRRVPSELNNSLIRILVIVKGPSSPAHGVTAGIQDGESSPAPGDALDVGNGQIKNGFLGHQSNQRRSTGDIGTHTGPSHSRAKQSHRGISGSG